MTVVTRVLGGPARPGWRRVFLILSASAALIVWLTLTRYGGNPVDAWDFWVDPAHPYASEDIHHYLYSPVFAQASSPAGSCWQARR